MCVVSFVLMVIETTKITLEIIALAFEHHPVLELHRHVHLACDNLLCVTNLSHKNSDQSAEADSTRVHPDCVSA